MGLSIKTNNKDKWELISSITDSVICECKTEQELKVHLAMEAIYKGKLRAIELIMKYPNGWTINDKWVPSNKNIEVIDEYYSWFKEINMDNETYADYYAKIDKKLAELLIDNN